MFEVGFTELLLIFALSLLVLGPNKLPKLAKQVGRWVGRARAMARQFRDQLEEEAHQLETKVSVDPGIDTSLGPQNAGNKSGNAAAPADGATPDSAATPPVPAVPAYTDGPEEEFYPPDHHMHPSQRAAADAGTQSELDLTTSEAPEAPKGTGTP